jgi:hypothetical protein
LAGRPSSEVARAIGRYRRRTAAGHLDCGRITGYRKSCCRSWDRLYITSGWPTIRPEAVPSNGAASRQRVPWLVVLFNVSISAYNLEFLIWPFPVVRSITLPPHCFKPGRGRIAPNLRMDDGSQCSSNRSVWARGEVADSPGHPLFTKSSAPGTSRPSRHRVGFAP